MLDLEKLSTLSERSVAWQLIKAEVTRRGHWKKKARGKGDVRKFVGTNIQSKDSHQVKWYPTSSFSDGL